MDRAPRIVRDLFAVALFGLTALGWAFFPAAVRHQAGVQPLLHRTVPLVAAEPAGGAAWLAVTAGDDGDDPSWSTRFVEVLERGRPLSPAPPRAVRLEGDGRYAVTRDGQILFAPSSGPAVGPPRAPGPPDLDRFAVRRPRSVPAGVARCALATLLILTAASAVRILVGLARAALLRPLVRWSALTAAAGGFAFLLLGAALPRTGTDLVGQKLERLRRETDDYHAVFIGSSRVYRQLEPDTFDRTYAAAGVPMRSFNLGAPDMRMLEVLHLTRWLLEREPERLELLVIDAESDPLFIREENLASERIVRWHDSANMRRIAPEMWRRAATPAAALYRIGRHSEPALLHLTRLGAGRDRVRWLLSPPRPESPPEQRGFYAGDEEMAQTPSQAQRLDLEGFHRRLHGDLERWGRDVARMARSERVSARTDPFELELFAELERLAAAAGVRAVFLLDARPEETPNLAWAAANGVVGTLLRFDDPRRYPELYDPTLRFDRHHVNKEGARLYTAEVARRILETSRAAP